MKVAVVCNFPFPKGLAATTRIKAYLKGLNECGCETKVYIINPSYSANEFEIVDSKGVTEDGISYEYASGARFSHKRIKRVLGNIFLNRYKALRLIAKQHKEAKIDYLFIANDQLVNMYLFISLCRFVGIKSIFITDEYPGDIRRKLKPRISSFKRGLYSFILKRVNRAIFMTEALNTYYNKDNRIKSHILPTITDYSRFLNIKKNIQEFPYLCYMGNMELAKDNVNNIIVAFSKIASIYPNLKFYLYGDPSPIDLDILTKLINSLNLADRVYIKGRVEYDIVPQILANAYILVSSQPNTKRAEGGFPTKLGEYLASGVPVVLTDVGEITKYVTNREHLYIVPPEQPEEYAKTLIYVIEHYSEALNVAKNGQIFLADKYDYKRMSKQLYSFLLDDEKSI